MPPLRVQLSDERRARVTRSLQGFFVDHFDEELSEFRAQALLEFCLEEVGPAVYNQGVHDACVHLQEKIADLEAEVYEPEPPPSR